MRWHRESQTNPFPSPTVPGPVPGPAPAPYQQGRRPTVPDDKKIQKMPEWQRNQVVSEILRMLGTASTEHLSALRDKMSDPQFMQGLVPPQAAPGKPVGQEPVGPMPPQVRQNNPAAPQPFDRPTPRGISMEKMKGVQPAETPVGTTPLTPRQKATQGRPPGMEQFVRQRAV